MASALEFVLSFLAAFVMAISSVILIVTEGLYFDFDDKKIDLAQEDVAVATSSSTSESSASTSDACEAVSAEPAPARDPWGAELTPVAIGGCGAVFADEHFAYKFCEIDSPVHAESMVREFDFMKAVAAESVHVVAPHYLKFANDQGCIAMELCDGTVRSYLPEDGGAVPEPQAVALFVQLADGLRACHAAGIIHGDVKMENFLVHEPPGCAEATIKLGDFGVASTFEEVARRGPLGWTAKREAPEVWAYTRGMKATVGPAADVWSLGLIMALFLASRRKFKNGFALASRVRADGERWDHVSLEMKGLLKSMLSLKAENRPTMEEVVAALEQQLLPVD